MGRPKTKVRAERGAGDVKRSVNYTLEEKRVLVRCALQFAGVLESKVTNSKSALQDKSECWKKIAEMFNANPATSVSYSFYLFLSFGFNSSHVHYFLFLFAPSAATRAV